MPRAIGISFGSPDTLWNYTYSDPDGTDLGPGYIDFEGGNSSAGTVRALLWERPTTDDVSPTKYVAFDSKPLTIDTATTKTVTFDMTPDGTMSDQVSGTVNPTMPGAIQVDGYLRFDDGAAIHIVQNTSAGSTFQMLMPKIPASSITVSALIGSTPYGPYTVAHVDGLTPGQGGIAIDVPAPVSQVAPAAGASNVAATAMFQWSASPRLALLYVYCGGVNQGDGPTQFFVVTEDYRAELPILSAGIPWPKGRQCDWSVELHGTYATVDQAAGPTGFFDPFGLLYYGELLGPKRDNQYFSVSGTYSLTTAP
jgi:hypothetical protein